jgi:hypothetical protein
MVWGIQEKSYVGMAQCFFCNEDSVILLDRRLKNSLPMRVGVIDMTPCNKCADLMKKGIILISISNDTTEEQMQGPMPNPYRTGGWCVVTQDAVERAFDGKFREFAIEKRFLFINDEAWEHLGLPKGGQDGL